MTRISGTPSSPDSLSNHLMKIRILWAAVLFGAGCILSSSTYAQVQFAEFTTSGAQDFQYVNNSGTSATFGTIPNGTNPGPVVAFAFDNFGGSLPADLQGFQNAYMAFTATTTNPATVNGSQLQENFGAGAITLTFTRTVAAAEGSNGKTNLLTVVFTPLILSGTSGGTSAAFSQSTPPLTNVTFTSDFLDFSNTNLRAFSISLTALSAALAQGPPGNFFNSFLASGTGVFSSNPLPMISLPEISPGLTMAAIIGVAITVESLRKRRRAKQLTPVT